MAKLDRVVVMEGQGKSPDGEHEYVVVNNYDELTDTLKDKNKLAIIVTIEGAHVFIDKKMASGKLSKPEMKLQLKQNIESIKAWERPPFIVNLAHHFYHGYCGHAKSFFQVEVAEGLLNQKKGIVRKMSYNYELHKMDKKKNKKIKVRASEKKSVS